MPNDAAFGSGADPSELTIETLASALRQFNSRKAPVSKLNDAIDIIEHLRTQALTLHEENLAAAAALQAREQEILKKERELALRQRAVNAVLGGEKVVSWKFW